MTIPASDPAGEDLCPPVSDTVTSAGAEQPRTPTATRRPKSYTVKQRRSVWLPVNPSTSLAAVLERCPSPAAGETVVGYLVGQLPGQGTRDEVGRWAFAPPPGWSSGDHLLHDGEWILRYRLEASGGEVELHRGSVWFAKADGRYTARQAADAAALLLEVIRDVWDKPDLPWLATPSTFGRDLWLRSIGPTAEYPTLPDELQRLIRSTSGQGRWQTPGERAGVHLAEQPATIPGLWHYDMRLGYAGMLSKLSVGPWTHDDRPDWEPYLRGRFRVAFEVPDGWAHVGLLPVKADDRRTWLYPNAPGEVYESWCDGAELAIAHRHGWRFRVLERIVGREGSPLDAFRKRFVKVREQLAARHRDQPIEAALAEKAARVVILHTVGGMHGAPHRVTRSLPDHRRRDIPADARGSLTRVGDVWVWTEQARTRWPETSHPEWSTAVYARCRARILEHRGTGALALEYGQVLAIHQDAIYTTAPTGWVDDGRVGTLRLEHARPGPWPTPATRSEVVQISNYGATACLGCGATPTIFPPDGSRWCAVCHPGWEDVPARRRAGTGARAVPRERGETAPEQMELV